MVDELPFPQLVNAGFLNHQPISLYFPLIGTLFPFEAGGAVASMLQSVVDQFREAGG